MKLPTVLCDGGGEAERRRGAGLFGDHHHLSAGPDGALASWHFASAEPSPPFAPLPGTERVLPAQLVLLAMGFLGPSRGCSSSCGVERDPRTTNIKDVRAYTTSIEGVFAAGDSRRGQSLIVWAINEGRQCARMVDRYLAGPA